tara:strand:- start:265 stop:993 length:729 start_codon:yes stop_codon:yes gene_type:complete
MDSGMRHTYITVVRKPGGMKPETILKYGPEKRKLKRLGVLMLLALIGGSSGTEYPPMEMNEMEMIVMAFFALTMSLLMTRKPRFEVPKEHSGLSAVNWFNLKRDSTAEVRVKQLYFGVGQDFMDAGWMIPAGAFDKLLCLVVAEAEVAVETANKGTQTWFSTLVTQSVAGDLYREALKAQQNKVLKWTPKTEIMEAPNFDYEIGSAFDVMSVNGGHNPSFLIVHEQHPTNPSKSLYKLTWNH